MEFALSTEQRQLQAALNRALDRLAPLERVRRFAETGEDVARDV
jgi:hypothetical protein